MASVLKIKPTSIVPKYGKGIHPTQIDDAEKVSFNFRRLKTENDKFNYILKEKQYFLKLVERLKSICDFNRAQLIANRSSSLRFHKINFNDCTETGFGLIPEDLNDEAFQLEVSANEHGRVHGYFVGNVFYVVWLDPKHELYK
jgi:hypothetical protein